MQPRGGVESLRRIEGAQWTNGNTPARGIIRQSCRKQFPVGGIDAPTLARIGTCRPMGRSHFSFDGKRKVCKRKPAARRLREKALYCPFLKEGVRNVARNIVGELTHAIVRARAHSHPLSKRARLFPSAAYRRSAPPQLAVGRLKWRCLRCIDAAGMVSQRGKTGLIFFCGWRRAYSSSAAVDISTYFGYFCNAKSQRGFETTLAFLCEP